MIDTREGDTGDTVKDHTGDTGKIMQVKMMQVIQ